MQRSNRAEVERWSQNRAGSIVMIGLSLIAIMVMIKVVFETASLYIKQQKLEVMKEKLQKEIDDLENRNAYLSDSSYYTIYIEDDFQLSGGNIIVIPRE
jgi:predicted membrane protein